MQYWIFLIPVAIVILAIVVAKGNSTTTAPTTSTPPVCGKTGFTNTLFGVLGVLAIIFVGVLIYKGYTRPPANNTNVIQQSPPPATTATTEALVLQDECYTRCTVKLHAYKTKIRTDGDPLWIKFQGVEHWFPHPGKGEVDLPSGVQEGDAEFVSRDPSDPTEGKEDSKNPKVRVWIYRVVTIQ